jgi:porin
LRRAKLSLKKCNGERRRLRLLGLTLAIGSVCGLTDAHALETGISEGTRAKSVKLSESKKRPESRKHTAGPKAPAPSDLAEPAYVRAQRRLDEDTSTYLKRLNKAYGIKGWNIPAPSFANAITQDAGGFRSALAKYGFGFVGYELTTSQGNMLDTPRQVPNGYPACGSPALTSLCRGNQNYLGQAPIYNTSVSLYLTYDTSQWGVPDGQIQVAGMYSIANNEAQNPNYLGLSQLLWYQTLFDGKLELKLGLGALAYGFQNDFIGGNLANPFGLASGSKAQLGHPSGSALSLPGAYLKWNFDGGFYTAFGVSQAMVVNGPTGNGIYDTAQLNPQGWPNELPSNTRAYFINEYGYRVASAPGQPNIWIRFGGNYGDSTFRDYSQLLTDPKATKDGSGSVFLLGDYQIWQQESSSVESAGRGIYIGMTATYADPKAVAFEQTYQARAYWVGPTASRSRDMIALSYSRNEVSGYLVAYNEAHTPLNNIYTNKYSNNVTLTYTAYLTTGLTGTLGVSYIDRPSVTYFPGEGSALLLLASTSLTF